MQARNNTARLYARFLSRKLSERFTVEAPHKPQSSFADCIFFNGLTRHQGSWWVYYGGSEYYTRLARADAAE